MNNTHTVPVAGLDYTPVDTRKLAFLYSLHRKARAAGLSIEGLKMEGAILDAHWGDLSGYVFSGLAEADLQRVVAYFVAWWGKHGPKGSYEAQNALRITGPATRYGFPNYAGRWISNGTPISSTSRATSVEHGIGVATTYYPCAD